MEIRNETATESGDVVEGYEKVWKLSHLMRNVPSRLERSNGQIEYARVLSDIEEGSFAFDISEWFNQVVTQENDFKHKLYALLDHVFVDLYEEGTRLNNKKIVAICSLMKGVSFQIMKAENHLDNIKICDELKQKSTSLRIRPWVDAVFSNVKV
jgi:hypothetical protein